MYVLPFRETGIAHVPQVGGKNASLGEMPRELSGSGIRVPDGFSVTADAYRAFLADNGLDAPVSEILAGLERGDVQDMTARARRIRRLIHGGTFSERLQAEVPEAYQELSEAAGGEAYVAVRSSATRPHAAHPRPRQRAGRGPVRRARPSGRACLRPPDRGGAPGRAQGRHLWAGPSDYPDFAAFLVERGVDSISLTPDSVLRTYPRIVEAERGLARNPHDRGLQGV